MMPGIFFFNTMPKNVNTVKGAVNGTNVESQNTGSTATDFMASHGVYDGIVSSVDYDTRLLTVNCSEITLSNCIYLPGAVAGLIGITVDSLPAVGAKCVVLRSRAQNYVISSQMATEGAGPTMSNFVAGNAVVDMREDKVFQTARNSEYAPVSEGVPAPLDMYPGEYGLSNAMGIALRALHNFIVLSAGDAAKVEAHLLNDMVRIVANYFVVHTAGGDTLDWSDGGLCNREEHYASHQYEADGMYKPGDRPLAAGAEKIRSYDPEKAAKPDPYDDTGRWRLSKFTGFLGDMIHMFVTTPTEMLTTYDKNARRNGQFRAHVGSDGTLVVQSHGGVCVHVTPHIQVPVLKHKWDHPDVDSMLKNFDAKYTELWGAGEDWKDLEYACWKMRRYLRYMVQYHSFQRFLSAKEYCEILPENQYNASVTGGDRPGPETSYGTMRSASLTIDPSGSITLQSNQHGSVIMNQGNIQIAAAGNLELQAGGTVSIQGRQVTVVSGTDMEIVSMVGRIAMKARTGLRALCERGKIWLKSDAKKGDEEYESDCLSIKSKSDYVDHAIVLDAPNDKILVAAERDLTLASTRGDIFLQAARGTAKLYAMGMNAIVRGVAAVTTATATLRSGIINLASPIIQFGEHMRLASKSLTVDGPVFVNMLEARGSIIGPPSLNGRVAQYDTPPDLVKATTPDESYYPSYTGNTDADPYSRFEETELEKDIWELRKWDDVVATEITLSESMKASLVYDYAINQKMPLQVPFEDGKNLIPGKRTAASPIWPGVNRDTALGVVTDIQDAPLDRAGTSKPDEYKPLSSPPSMQEYKYYFREPKKPYPLDPAPAGSVKNVIVNYYDE